MKRVLLAIARALAAIPKMAWTVCTKTGQMILSLIPAPAGPVTTAAGGEADEALEMAQARQEQAEMAPKSQSQAHIALAYAATLVAGGSPPNLVGQPPAFVRWLEDLTASAARRLFKASVAQIEAHLDPKCVKDHLEGVPSIGARPTSAAAVGLGSHKGNLAHAKIVDDILAEVVFDEEDEAARRAA